MMFVFLFVFFFFFNDTATPEIYTLSLHDALPFYSHGDLQYLEHGTGPVAAELRRLWRAKGTMRGGTARQEACHDGDGWRALPRGATGLAPRRRHSPTVTDLYYPGLQDPPGHDGRNAQPAPWMKEPG